MSAQPADEGFVVDADIIKEISTYYAVIGFGLGILSFILLSQFAGGVFVGQLIRGIISFMIFLFAFLVSPVIAAFTATIANTNDSMSAKSQVINCGIAAGVGFVVFGIVVLLLLSIGLSLFSQGQTGGISLGQSIPIIILLTLPNALVGGGMKYALFITEGEGDFRTKEGAPQASLPSINISSEGSRVSRRTLLIAGGGIAVIGGGWFLLSQESSLSYGDTVQGEIVPGGPDDPIYGDLSARHTFRGVVGERVVIEMESNSFDTYLVIIGPSGDVIAEDDDGGYITDSRVRFTVQQTGEHVIWAGSFSGSATGSYTLSLS